jgi:hypothetical protein
MYPAGECQSVRLTWAFSRGGPPALSDSRQCLCGESVQGAGPSCSRSAAVHGEGADSGTRDQRRGCRALHREAAPGPRPNWRQSHSRSAGHRVRPVAASTNVQGRSVEPCGPRLDPGVRCPTAGAGSNEPAQTRRAGISELSARFLCRLDSGGLFGAAGLPLKGGTMEIGATGFEPARLRPEPD